MCLSPMMPSWTVLLHWRGSLEDVTGVTIPRGALLTSTSTPTEEEPTEGPAPLEVAT